MPEIQLSAGTIEYSDTGGDGPVVVFLHGVLMDSSLWDDVIARLGDGVRCIAPTLPLGGHRIPIDDGVALTPRLVAVLVGELLERLDLREVTIVGVDTGGALAQFVVVDQPQRVERLALLACDAFENFPPGLPGRVCVLAAAVPGGLYAALAPLRWRALRRLPVTFGWMSKRPVPDATMDAWLRPAQTDRRIRRDLTALLRAVDRRELLAAASRLGEFDGPVLVAWAVEDKIMPAAHGRRLAELFPHSTYVEIADSRTLVPVDQPAELARLVLSFVTQPAPVR